MLFGGQIGDLCNGCYAEDFALLGEVHVEVVDSTCVFVWTAILDLSPFLLLSWSLVKFV